MAKISVGALIDDRQRELFARYLLSAPLVKTRFLDSLRAKIRSPNLPENQRTTLENLLRSLERRLGELKIAADKAHAEHRRRRSEILGRGQGKVENSRAREPAQD